MDPDEFVVALEQGRWRRLDPVPDGAATALFARVLELYANDPDRAAAVGHAAGRANWPADQRPLALRTQALGLYCAGQWLRAADTFRKSAATPTTRAYAIPAIDALARAGRIDEAVRYGQKLVRQLRGEPVMAARARVNLANALEQADRAREALRQYRAAVEGLRGSAFRSDYGKALAGTSTGLIAAGRYREARVTAEEAISLFRESGEATFEAICTVNLAQIEVAEGRLDVGLRLLQDCETNLPASRRAWFLEILGDTLFALNEWAAAADTYGQAIELLSRQSRSIGYANALLGLAAARAQEGRMMEAAAALRRAMRRHQLLRNPGMLALDGLLATELAVAQQQWSAARRHARQALPLARNAGLQFAESRLILADALSAARRGQFDRTMLREVRRVARSSATGLRWRAQQVLAIAMPRRSQRVAAWARMADEIVASRLLVQSTSARMNFIADKKQALQEALFELLSSGSRSEEQLAISILRRTRSATLFDEILSAFGGTQPTWQAQFDDLRREIAESAGDDDLPSYRRSPMGIASGRAWARLLHESRALNGTMGNTAKLAGECYVQTDLAIFVIRDGTAVDRLASPAEIDRLLKVLRFELFTPLTCPEEDGSRCLGVMARLRTALGAPKGGLVVPDETLWSVPWSAITDEECVLALAPREEVSDDWCLPEQPKVLVWAGCHQGLPNVEREIEALVQRFPDAVVCRSRDEAWRASANGTFDIVHVAAHGFHASDNPMLSAIQFPDGFLSAAEVARMNLRLTYAVLSSCESGRVTAATGEPNGWVRAFLARGARAALATAWMIDDQMALDLAQGLYARWDSTVGLRRATASVRAAIRAQRPHPFYWASPTIFAGHEVISHGFEEFHS